MNTNECLMNTKRNQLSTKMVYQGVPESGVPELAAPVYMYKLTGLYTYGMRNAAMPFLNPYASRRWELNCSSALRSGTV